MIRTFVSKNEDFFEETFLLRYGIIFPKVLQIKIFLFLRKLNYVNLNLVKFHQDIENGILLPISNVIFSS